MITRSASRKSAARPEPPAQDVAPREEPRQRREEPLQKTQEPSQRDLESSQRDQEPLQGHQEPFQRQQEPPRSSPPQEMLPQVTLRWPRNPDLCDAMETFPEYSRGYMQWLLLTPEVRRKIYYYHTVGCTALSRHSSLPLTPPLAQACKTFRRELLAVYAEQEAFFNGPELLKKFVDKWMTRNVLPYLLTFTVNMTRPIDHFQNIAQIRALLNEAHRYLRFVTTINFLIPIKLLHQMDDLSRLMLNGTLTRYPELEKVSIRDPSMEKMLGNVLKWDEREFVEKVNEFRALRGGENAQTMKRTVEVVRKANSTMAQAIHAWRTGRTDVGDARTKTGPWDCGNGGRDVAGS